MADALGDPHAAVKLLAALAEEPHRFDFFEAMRRLECTHPDRPRLGTSARPAEDPIRLGQEPSMRFAPAALARLDRGRGTPRLLVNFLGLLGPNGPLPLHLTEHARDRARDVGDHTFAAFLDIFHHRMLSLFYRAWASSRPAVEGDRPHADRFAFYLGALSGAGTAEADDHQVLPRRAGLFFAGRLAAAARTAESLGAMVEAYFGVPTAVDEFAGHWVAVPPASHCHLDADPATCALGRSAVLGTAVWDRQSEIALILGPMPGADYERMLPGGRSLDRLSAMVETFTGRELGCRVELRIRRQDIEPLRLGRTGKLGWTSWMDGRPAANADRLVLTHLDSPPRTSANP